MTPQIVPEIIADLRQVNRYRVYSVDSYRNYPNCVPAGAYDSLEKAIAHSETVNYPMAVVDSRAESRGFIYVNQR